MIEAAVARTVLGGTALADPAAAILGAVLDAADPSAWIRRNVDIDGPGLRIGTRMLAPEPGGVLRVLGIGKPAPAMVGALLEQVGDRIAEALAIGKHGTPRPCAHPRLTVRLAGHPLPDIESIAAGEAALALAARTGPRDRLLVIVGGGASALAVAPVEGLELAALREANEVLARAGTAIEILNAVRGRLDRIKHGGLARAAHGRALALVLDDIPGGDRFAVGSGPMHMGAAPTIPDDVAARLSPSIRAHLTPRSTSNDTTDVEHIVVADNEIAIAAALAAAQAHGYLTVRAPRLRGEARDAGRTLAELARRTSPRPFAIVCGGECTVTRSGTGRGGRTLELGIAAALAGLHGTTVLALATDGDDGSSNAAGAIVDGTTLARASAMGLDLAHALATHDTAPVLEQLGDLLYTGPTGTNVCDVVVLLGG